MFDYTNEVLAIHAHPRDAEFFCGGTLKLLKDEGYNINIANMTAGGLRGTNSTECQTIINRKKEATKVAELLDADYFCLDQRDGFLFDNEKIRIQTIELIRTVQPSIVITHLPNSLNISHRITSQIVGIACELSGLPNFTSKSDYLKFMPSLYYSGNLFSYEDKSCFNISKPCFFVNISNSMEDKLTYLEQHKSQIEVNHNVRSNQESLDNIKRINNEMGKSVKCEYAEAFWQHFDNSLNNNTIVQDVLKEYII